MRNFIQQALQTLSPSWHGDKVSKAHFTGRINGAIDAINKLDALKKTLFYGRDNNLIAEGQKDVSDLLSHINCGDANAANIVHAIIGKVTEAGELLELLRNTYNGKPFDSVNAGEEIGDGFWYDAILLREINSTFGAEQERVIRKLRKRYPDKFTEYDAQNRDLDAERLVLESDVAIPHTGFSVHAEPLESDHAPLDPITQEPMALVPTIPASGSVAVNTVEVAANEAFNRMQKQNNLAVEAGDVMPVTSEMSKPIGERKQLMPGEVLARQPIRNTDV